MILTVSKRALLAAMIFQAKKSFRYYLNGICFAPSGKLYSSDGCRAFVGEHETEGLESNIIIAIKSPRFVKFEKAKIDTDTGLVTYEDEHGVRVMVGLAEVIDGQYPDIERVVPKDNQPVTEIGFNASYLADIEKAAKLYSPRFESIIIKPNGNTNASIIELGKASVIVMPTRIE